MNTNINLKFNDVTGKIDLGNEATLTALGLAIVAQAKALAPVKTGRLKNSITYTKDNFPSVSDGRAFPRPTKDGEVYVGTNVDYARELEYGTRTRNPQPYMIPAMEIINRKAIKIAKQKVNDALKGLPRA